MPAVERAAWETRSASGRQRLACGPNLKKLDAENVEACMPTETDFREVIPPTGPIPPNLFPGAMGQTADEWRQACSSAFLYDSQRDEYRCPMGKGSHRAAAARESSRGTLPRDECPAARTVSAGRCLVKNTRTRTLRRDEYQDLRDTVGRRMATQEGIQLYKRRGPLIETVFARIKVHMGIRQFLLRGLDKVRTEWSWICLAYNLKLLLKLATDTTKPPLTHGPTSSHALWRPQEAQ